MHQIWFIVLPNMAICNTQNILKSLKYGILTPTVVHGSFAMKLRGAGGIFFEGAVGIALFGLFLFLSVVVRDGCLHPQHYVHHVVAEVRFTLFVSAGCINKIVRFGKKVVPPVLPIW